MDQTSASLLERLRAPSDREAWNRFAEIYEPLLNRWLLRYQLQHHDACDVAQEVLAIAARELPGFQYDPGRGAFRGWLRSVLTNQLPAFWRGRNGQPAGVGSDEWQDRLAALEDPASELSAQWDCEYNQQVAQRTLALIQNEFETTTWKAFWGAVVDGRKPD